MSHAPRPCDVATLLSQQRFLRQQEQQVRAELHRLSRTQPFTVPEDRPLSPPPPQRPIERRSGYRARHGLTITDGPAGSSPNRAASAARGLQGSSQEGWHPRGVSAAVARRQREVLQEQQERQQRLILQQQQQQQSAQHPASFGRHASGLIGSCEVSPYTFDLDGAPTACEHPGRPQRSATSPVFRLYGGSGDSRRRLRQVERVSPRSLPAAGLPSGNKRGGQKEVERRQRRLVLPLDAVEATLPAGPRDAHWQLVRGQSSTHTQHNMRCLPNEHSSPAVEAPQSRALPSTSPPALHQEPSGLGSSYRHQRQLESAFKGVLSSERALPEAPGGRERAGVGVASAFCATYCQKHCGELQRRPPFQPSRSGRQPGQPQAVPQPLFVEQTAAGMPSSKMTRETWEFRQSLRSEQEPKAARAPSHYVKVSGLSGRAHASYGDTRGMHNDDEETLKSLGLNLSPRELLYFKKQPSLRRNQLPARPVRSCTSTEAKQSPEGELPLKGLKSAANQEDVRSASSPPQGGPGDVCRLPQTNPWSLPSWMRTYGLPNPSAYGQARSAAVQRHHSAVKTAAFRTSAFDLQTFDDGGPYNTTAFDLNAQNAARCSCRCCRLREAAAGGPSVGGQPCCCCPCCNALGLRAEGLEGHPAAPSSSSADGNGDSGQLAASGKRDSVAAATGQCSRCGKLWEAKTAAEGSPKPPKQSFIRRNPPGVQPAPLCGACAAYLECERQRGAERVSALSLENERMVGGILAKTETAGSCVDPLQRGRRMPLNGKGLPHVSKEDDAEAAHSQALAVGKGKEEPAVASPQQRRLSSSAPGVRQNIHKGQGSYKVTRAGERGPSNVNTAASGPSAPESPSGEETADVGVWQSARIVAKVCLFLPLSKLLLVRRCNKTFLQAAQFRMRFILYKSLHTLLNQPADSAVPRAVVVEGHHCPISADALIKLLGLEADEVDAVKAGDLPPAVPDEAATPRMQDVAAAIRRQRASLLSGFAKEKIAGRQPNAPLKKPTAQQLSFPADREAIASDQPLKPSNRASQEAAELKPRLLLYKQMVARQAAEEARLREMLQEERAFDQQAAAGYDEAAGPVTPPLSVPLWRQSAHAYQEPATFRRVRHSFLKLWNYDDEAFRQALVRATSTSYPTWLFDAAALLLRATFQLCCNSLSAPPLKDLISLLAPRPRPGAVAEVPCRADTYLWAKMARISGYAMHLVIDQTWPPRRDAAVRLVSRPLTDPAAFISGGGVGEQTLQFAAVEGGGAASLVLRPSVVDSLELKMSKLHPEFIAEFVAYGKQQQMLHSGDQEFLRRGEIRQYKASQELVLLMDLYEWLAAVLTHNQRSAISTTRPRMPPSRGPAAHHMAREQITKAEHCAAERITSYSLLPGTFNLLEGSETVCRFSRNSENCEADQRAFVSAASSLLAFKKHVGWNAPRASASGCSTRTLVRQSSGLA
ncbi:hypothetical protein Efla_006848 [Eimeria flavescens]